MLTRLASAKLERKLKNIYIYRSSAHIKLSNPLFLFPTPLAWFFFMAPNPASQIASFSGSFGERSHRGIQTSINQCVFGQRTTEDGSAQNQKNACDVKENLIKSAVNKVVCLSFSLLSPTLCLRSCAYPIGSAQASVGGMKPLVKMSPEEFRILL